MKIRALRPRFEPLEEKSLLSVAAPVMQSTSASAQSIAVSLSTNQHAYRPGQPVQITLTATNTTNHAVNIGLGPSIDGFSVTQNNATVWRSNSGIQPMFVELRTIPAHGSITLTSTWNGQANEARLVRRTGVFVVHSQIPNVHPVAIRIRAGHR